MTSPSRGISRPRTERPKNRLLARLSHEAFERLQPHLDTVPITSKQVLQHRNTPIEYVYFPNGGVASITTVMQNGQMVEVATVGVEGLIGMDLFFGGGSSAGEAMVQVPDTSAERMTAVAFKEQLAQNDALMECVRRYGQGLIALMMQSTACVALHTVHERCARWLLMTHDRVHSDDFLLSHEFLAMMLGSSRPTVTLVASTLQTAGLIRYLHGKIRIVDRAGLEAASCECYASVRETFNRLGL
jgi:CRP-like cAMP-binding protein